MKVMGIAANKPGIFLALALLPLLLGGKAHSGDSVSEGSRATPADSVPFWIFFTEEGWEDGGHSRGEVALPGRLRTRSHWLKGVSVLLPLREVPGLRDLPGVSRVRPVRRLKQLAPSEPSDRHSGPVEAPSIQADTTYGDLGPILQELQILAVHELGFLGSGTRIGILDGHFSPGHSVLRSNPPLATRDFVDGGGSVEPDPGDPPGSADHGTGLWSLISGDLPGSLTGTAPGAQILLARIHNEVDPPGADEDRWVEGLEWLETQGARVVLSGVGFRNFDDGGYEAGDLNGDVAPATLAADEAARRGVLVVTPVGNGGPGPGSLASPADGDSVLAVGSVNQSGNVSSFSARGPTADGRPKPDLYARGEGLPVASGPGDDTLGEAEGTEFAGALLAGAAALFVEAYPERGPMEALQALLLSAQPLNGSGATLPQVAPAILFPDGISPLPLQEVDGEGQVTNLAPQFRWDVPTSHPLGLPVTFHLEVAEDSLFQQLQITDSVVGTFARRLQEPLPPRTRLFWRVVAFSAQGVRRATPPQGPMEVPPWVTLDVLNDPGGSQVTDPQPDFQWTALELAGSAGPFTFELQITLDREGEVIQSYGGLREKHHRLEEPLPFNVPLRWSLIAQARTGAADTVTSAGPFVVTGGENPPVTILYQNFPNPFPNRDEGIAETRIWFDLATPSPVKLAIYDLRGRLVRNLIPARGCGRTELPPGLYGRDGGLPPDPCMNFAWDGRDDVGRQAASGVYLLRLQAGGVVSVRRVVFWP